MPPLGRARSGRHNYDAATSRNVALLLADIDAFHARQRNLYRANQRNNAAYPAGGNRVANTRTFSRMTGHTQRMQDRSSRFMDRLMRAVRANQARLRRV